MPVIVNIKSSADVPARQRKAWEEFLDMLVDRAGAEKIKEEELEDGRQKCGEATGGSGQGSR